MKTSDNPFFIINAKFVRPYCSDRSLPIKANLMADRQGVTLVELLTVLAILAILLALGGIGLLRGLPERQLMSAARDLYCGLRQAQSRAVAQGNQVTVNFNPESDTFSLTDTDGHLISSTLLPGYIDLYKITGDNKEENHYFFNSRGIKTGVSGSVHIKHRKPGYVDRRVVVRATGAMTIQRSNDNGETWK